MDIQSQNSPKIWKKLLDFVEKQNCVSAKVSYKFVRNVTKIVCKMCYVPKVVHLALMVTQCGYNMMKSQVASLAYKENKKSPACQSAICRTHFVLGRYVVVAILLVAH